MHALAFGFPATGACGSLRITPCHAFHEPIQRFGAIGWIGMIVPRGVGHFEDPILREPEVVNPAAHMGPGRPALPPGGEGCIVGKAQRREKLNKKPIKITIARSRVLLLLYWFP